MKSAFILIVLIMCFLVHADAQEMIPYNQQAEIYFGQAVTNFEQRNFIAAALMFQQVEKDFPLHQRTTAAIIMEAKSLFQLEQYDSSIQVLTGFMRRFPGSSYGDDARFTLGENYYVQRRYRDVVPEMLFIIEKSGDSVLVNHAEALLTATCLFQLPLDEVYSISTRVSAQRAVIATKKILAQKYALEGEFAKGVGVLKNVIALYPRDPHRRGLDSLITVFQKGTRIKIGLLLPALESDSQNPDREIASEIFEGAKFAADEFSRSTTILVTLEPRDTRRDLVRISQETEDLAADSEVIGVIGPIFSDEVEVAARVAVRHSLPLITPTATATGLTQWGREIFQGNPDYLIRGTLMAKFAVEELGLKTFAVLHSTRGFSTQMADAFVSEIHRLGGQVIVRDSYEGGGGDLQKQMTRIRNASLLMQHPPMFAFSSKMKKGDAAKFLRAGVPQSVIDSLIDRNLTTSAGTLFGAVWKSRIDSFHLPVLWPVVDTIGLQTVATGIEALYAPIASPDEIGVIGAQLTYYNIRTQILGSGDWYRIEELDANSRYVNGVYFDADNYTPKDDSTYIQFAYAFQKASGKPPTKNAVLGYDTMKMLLSLIDERRLQRPEFLKRLTSLTHYHTLHSIISFTDNRVNGSLTILRYKDGQIQEITHEFLEGEPNNGTQ